MPVPGQRRTVQIAYLRAATKHSSVVNVTVNRSDARSESRTRTGNRVLRA